MRARPSLAIGSMVLCIFVIGSAELIITGILPQLADALQVPIGTAGLLVTIYAFAVAVGGPVIAALTLKVDRKHLLLALMLLFVVGNLICMLGGAYSLVAAGRVVSAVSQGSLFASTAVIAMNLVDPSRIGRTMSALAFGLNLATVAGTPLGTAVAADYGWPAAFVLLAVLGVAFTGAAAAFVPRVASPPDTSVRRDFAVLRHPQVLQSILITALGQAGLFTAVTYIAPILEARGFTGELWQVLLLFGVASLVGNVAAGYLTDWNPDLSLTVIVALLAGSLVWLWAAGSPGMSVIAFAAIGCFGFAIIPGMQARILAHSSGAPTLALTFNVSAFNVGNGLGALLGSVLLASGLALPAIPLGGAVLAAACTAMLILNRLVPNGQQEREEYAEQLQ